MHAREMLMLAAGLAALACGPGPEDDGAVDEQVTADTAEAQAEALDPARGTYLRPSGTDVELTSGDTLPDHPSWTTEDWAVLDEAVRAARAQGLDTLPIGERAARIGEMFVGTVYVPQTLDPEGPERLVVNLRALDCVTYVENMLALAWFVRHGPPDILEDRDRAIDLYEDILTTLRYRDGVLGGYPSRLHYFSEWLQDNEEKGLVEVVTQEIGGEPLPGEIHFMSSHQDAYAQLVDPQNLREIRRIEERLSGQTRYYVPQERVAEVQEQIRTGDIIAATSTLDGLDVAHTGFALWRGDTLHLMHAPLVGEDVQISERPLAERLLGIGAQDGIMVGRPLEVEPGRFTGAARGAVGASDALEVDRFATLPPLAPPS